MRAVPIPGEILRTDVFLGLTFNELVTLGAAPIVLVFPSLFIDQIPLVVTIGLAALFGVGVIAVVLQTPEGQTPLEWAPAAAQRRLKPDKYHLKPRHRKRDELRHLDVVETAEQIHTESIQAQAEAAAEDTSTVGSISETLPGGLTDIGSSATADTSQAESVESFDEDGGDRSEVPSTTADVSQLDTETSHEEEPEDRSPTVPAND